MVKYACRGKGIPRVVRCFIITLTLVLPLLLSGGCARVSPSGHASPVISQEKIAFVSCREDAHGCGTFTTNNTTCSPFIYVMDPDDSNVVNLTGGTPGLDFYCIWSPK